MNWWKIIINLPFSENFGGNRRENLMVRAIAMDLQVKKREYVV
jgi:hypothetical protein